jgi:hypothetical protein
VVLGKARGTSIEGDVRQAFEVLQAIRVLQRWLVARPLGADGLCLTATSLTLSTGQDRVATVTIPILCSRSRSRSETGRHTLVL